MKTPRKFCGTRRRPTELQEKLEDFVKLYEAIRHSSSTGIIIFHPIRMNNTSSSIAQSKIEQISLRRPASGTEAVCRVVARGIESALNS